MTNSHAFGDFVARRLHERTALLSYLSKPYLLLYAGFLFVMVALSFAIPLIHSASMAARWPALGLLAVVGGLLPIVSRWRPMTTPHAFLAIFLVLVGFSTLYAAEKFYTVQRFASVVMLFAATIIGLFAYCRDWRSAVRITDLLWCIGSLLVLVGFIFRAGAGAMGDAGERFEGLHSRATGAGTYAALFLPIAIYQASYRFRGVWQLFAWCVVLLFIVQALLSGARAALGISLLVSLALGSMYNARRAMIAAILAAILSPVPFLMKPDLVDRFKEKGERLLRAQTFSTFTGRLDRWIFGIEQWQRKPVIGHGFGASRFLAGQEDPRRFKLEPGEVFNLHSDQIEVLMDVGVVGYVPFALFWISLLVLGWKTAFSPRSVQRQMALAYFGALFYAFVDTFMHGGFLAAGGGVSAFSWSMIALFLAVHPMQKLLPSAPPKSEAPPVITVVGSPRRPPRLRPAVVALPSARNLRRATS
jgi:O-antigen ligase